MGKESNAAAAVYVQTNDAAKNEVLAFERGTLGTRPPRASGEQPWSEEKVQRYAP